MSEEQPTFKVRDRRLFNADGTPREVEREEAPETAAAEAAAPEAEASSSSSSGGSSVGGGNAVKAAAASAEAASSATASSATGERASGAASGQASAVRDTDTRGPSAPEGARSEEEDLYAEGDVPGADDPTSFINFLMSIASNAAASLGMMEHPVTGQRGVDLPLAKHWIDVLGMLQQKTRGNLVEQERQIFEGLLSDLRMQYVSLTTPPSAPRGFTGRDIIGGK
jgi:cobalamin biosynthesis Mg chelatase CobN